MKVEYINPFIASVRDLFTTMLDAKAVRGNLAVVKETNSPLDIVALIGLSGPIQGAVALAFPVKTALNIAGRLLGTEIHVMDKMVSDAIAEVVNIVAGSAKAKLKIDNNGKPVTISLPTVVRGKGVSVEYPTQTIWLEVPFESDLGSFVMRVTFKMDDKHGKEQS